MPDIALSDFNAQSRLFLKTSLWGQGSWYLYHAATETEIQGVLSDLPQHYQY